MIVSKTRSIYITTGTVRCFYMWREANQQA